MLQKTVKILLEQEGININAKDISLYIKKSEMLKGIYNNDNM